MMTEGTPPSQPSQPQLPILPPLNKDGSPKIARPRRAETFFTDLYYDLLSVSWPAFFTIITVVYIVTNLVFAALYFACGPEAIHGIHATTETARFMDCLFFSVQTLATIGYGQLAPQGFGPNMLVFIQAFLGIMILATTTGLLYARFSRPTARVLFSNKAIVTLHNGRRCFIVRVANERLNQIAEAHMTMTLTKNELSLEGEINRKFYDMKLERDYSPIFALSWTVRHYIDADSPLLGMDEAKLREAQTLVIASLTGIDETLSQTITARRSYTPDDILFNRRFKDIITIHHDKIHIDLKGIHDVQDVSR